MAQGSHSHSYSYLVNIAVMGCKATSLLGVHRPDRLGTEVDPIEAATYTLCTLATPLVLEEDRARMLQVDGNRVRALS